MPVGFVCYREKTFSKYLYSASYCYCSVVKNSGILLRLLTACWCFVSLYSTFFDLFCFNNNFLAIAENFKEDKDKDVLLCKEIKIYAICNADRIVNGSTEVSAAVIYGNKEIAHKPYSQLLNRYAYL